MTKLFTIFTFINLLFYIYKQRYIIKELDKKKNILEHEILEINAGLIKKVNEKTIKVNNKLNQDYNITFENKNKYCKFSKYIEEEIYNLQKYKYEIYKKTKKNVNNITIQDIIEYKFKTENMNKSRKRRFINKVNRCLYIYKKYGNKLNISNLTIFKLSDMSKHNWDFLTIKIDEHFNKLGENIMEEKILKN